MWDPDKNRANRRAHGLSFETAALVFDDPYPHEPRWRTMGMIGSVVVMVVHTCPEFDLDHREQVGCIISARKATRHERRAYEEGDF